MAGFGWVDWLLFALLILVSLGIGIFTGLRANNSTTEEVLVGGRGLSVFPVTMSIFMSFISAILVLGNATEMYLSGAQMWLIWIGYTLAYMLVPIIVVPLFYRLKLTSSFEYFDKRFKTPWARRVGDVLMIIYQLLYMGIATFAPSTAMEAATGFPLEASIVIIIVVATIYTSFGGIKAVVWTDAIQGLVFIAGIIACLVEGTNRVGSLEKVWEYAEKSGRFDMWNFNLNPYEDRLTFWSCVIGVMFGAFGMVGVNQSSVQRYCSLPSLKKAQLSIFILIPFEIVMTTLTCLVGLVLFAYYEQLGCDPLRSGQLDDSNQLLPNFITDVIAINGLSGLFMAVLFSGALSSVSSSLSSLSAVTWKDVLESRFSHLPQRKQAFITQMLAVVFGVISMAVAFAIQFLGVHVLQASSSLTSVAAGPLLGMFLSGFLFPWINGIGVSLGAVISLGVMMWISIGSSVESPYQSHLPTTITNCTLIGNATIAPIPEDVDALFIYKLSFFWYDAMGSIMTIILAAVISLCTGCMDPNETDPRLILPIFDKICCCLPLSFRRALWCGVNHDEVQEWDDRDKDEIGLEETNHQTRHKISIGGPGIYKEDLDSVSKLSDGNYRKFSVTDIENVLEDHFYDDVPLENNSDLPPPYDGLGNTGVVNPALTTEL